jgi:hypothetical protein
MDRPVVVFESGQFRKVTQIIRDVLFVMLIVNQIVMSARGAPHWYVVMVWSVFVVLLLLSLIAPYEKIMLSDGQLVHRRLFEAEQIIDIETIRQISNKRWLRWKYTFLSWLFFDQLHLVTEHDAFTLGKSLSDAQLQALHSAIVQYIQAQDAEHEADLVQTPIFHDPFWQQSVKPIVIPRNRAIRLQQVKVFQLAPRVIGGGRSSMIVLGCYLWFLFATHTYHDFIGHTLPVWVYIAAGLYIVAGLIYCHCQKRIKAGRLKLSTISVTSDTISWHQHSLPLAQLRIVKAQVEERGGRILLLATDSAQFKLGHNLSAVQVHYAVDYIRAQILTHYPQHAADLNGEHDAVVRFWQT